LALHDQGELVGEHGRVVDQQGGGELAETGADFTSS
jgi:hypothetical protein